MEELNVNSDDVAIATGDVDFAFWSCSYDVDAHVDTTGVDLLQAASRHLPLLYGLIPAPAVEEGVSVALHAAKGIDDHLVGILWLRLDYLDMYSTCILRIL